MLATVLRAPRDIRLEDLPDPKIQEATDAVMRVVLACICGSDLWPYRGWDPIDPSGKRMGHEAIGVVEEVGKEVRTLKPGDLVLMPFAFSDGTCPFCQEKLYTSCVQGGFFSGKVPGSQAEAVRIPLAEGTLYPLPGGLDPSLFPHLLTLTDVMGTGHHAARVARVGPGKIVAVIGDGAVGLCAVLASKRLGAERIILLVHHEERARLAQEFGATDLVRERGEGAVEVVRELTHGEGAHAVLECVGTEEAMVTALKIVRPGGAIGRVGVPHHEAIPARLPFYGNILIGGGPAPTRAYMEELLPDVLALKIMPGKVFDRTLPLREVAEGYRAMDERRAIKVLLRP